MRHKDENKSEAIFHATIQLLNEIGFSDISMSKIAKRANVSSATIYVYFENKEDMLGKLYLKVKDTLSRQMLQGLHEAMTTKEFIEAFMRNSFRFMLTNPDSFLFLEQFSSSPLLDKLCLADTATMFTDLHRFVEKGKLRGELKPYDVSLLLTYCYAPLKELAKEKMKGNYDESELEKLIVMSWDAIKA